ncbi:MULTISPECIES: hypothetical protein [Mesonia]|uniref:Uncharacterized protein n=1 Tax=Mesonia oceanica TaxID=2687242 RepID=A0AC61Y5S4_9FLAO|nr:MULTISPECIES: hypothetical protein [Mesonia]MAN26193.1 hypothetical protein [Mesonia sp.]MAQ42625.1 hypothetical protein [Mesonia sp.]VVU99838.1 hypothetical protein FVB9532_01099 [Mesonia oceanica]
MKKNIKYLFYSLLLIVIASCTEDEGLEELNTGAPTNIAVDFSITQDNSGEVTMYPSGEGANSFIIDYGDGSEVSEEISTGNNSTHVYEEGTYEVTVTAMNLAGDTASMTQTLVVSFSAPENLEVTITKDASNPFLVNVSAEAVNAAAFEVYFGEEQGETATPMMIGETVSYEYSSIGTYTITVIALSGGEETTTYTEEIEIVDPLVLPITFESETVDYTFYNFGGGEATGVPLVSNPAPSEVNNSETVASYTKVAGSETWAGTSVTLNEAIDFSTTSFISMDVYSPTVGTPILFKIEDSDNSDNFVEFQATTTVANEWETIVFDLSGLDQSITYEVIALFFNFNTSGTGETYYFDNIQLASPTIVELPITFEGSQSAYAWTEFGGAPVTIEPNPDMSDANPSATVAKMFKVNNSLDYAGAFMDLDNPVDFNQNTSISMKVWSPEANTTVTLKFEDPQDGAIFAEANAVTTVANAWQTITFDFSGVDVNQNYQRMVLFFDFGSIGTGLDYYFDDISYANQQPVSLPNLPLTFESESIEYNWMNFGGATSTVVDNPDMNGNTSNKVTELIKDNGSQTWAGSNIILENAIDFSSSQTMKMKVWSPIANAPILLKLETSAEGNDYFMEVQTTTSGSSQWEELTFDFSGISTTEPIDIVTVFMNFGENGMGNTYYFDDIELQN